MRYSEKSGHVCPRCGRDIGWNVDGYLDMASHDLEEDDCEPEVSEKQHWEIVENAKRRFIDWINNESPN